MRTTPPKTSEVAKLGAKSPRAMTPAPRAVPRVSGATPAMNSRSDRPLWSVSSSIASRSKERMLRLSFLPKTLTSSSRISRRPSIERCAERR